MLIHRETRCPVEMKGAFSENGDIIVAVEGERVRGFFPHGYFTHTTKGISGVVDEIARFMPELRENRERGRAAVARRSHCPEVGGSNPPPATIG